MSGKTYTGSIEILVQAIEKPGAPERIFNYSGTDSFLMTIVGDQVVMLFERFPENIQGRFKKTRASPWQSNTHYHAPTVGVLRADKSSFDGVLNVVISSFSSYINGRLIRTHFYFYGDSYCA